MFASYTRVVKANISFGCPFIQLKSLKLFLASHVTRVTHLAYTWTCVYSEPEIKVRQHSREDIK